MKKEERNNLIKEVMAYLSVMVNAYTKKERMRLALKATKALRQIHKDEQEENS